MQTPTEPLSPAAHTTEGLDRSWGELGRPGGWWNGHERIQIAREVRSARGCPLCSARREALSPQWVDDQSHAVASDLSEPVVELIHRIATDPGRLSRRWFDEAMAGGMRPEELVEITSIIGVVTLADTLARALSQPERPLPGATPGEPHRQVVPETKTERAWVPTVEPGKAEGMLKMLYDQVEAEAGFVFNVARALTAVPEAVRDFFMAFIPNYSTHGDVRSGGLDRTQVELLASSTSAWNDCFY